MRYLAATVALVTLLGCASGTQGPRSFNVQLFEHRGFNRAVSVQGQHAFIVRITNRSEESVTIDSISLSSFSNQLTLYNADQMVGQALEPGQTADFPMFVDVQVLPQTRIYVIDSLNVAVTCTSSSKGDFTESSSQSVTAM
jgi:hypothetical protein